MEGTTREMTLDEMQARITELKANEDRQPKDDAELEDLQRQVSIITSKPESPVVEKTEVPMTVLKEQAKAKGIMYRVGMTKAFLLNAIKEIEKKI